MGLGIWDQSWLTRKANWLCARDRVGTGSMQWYPFSSIRLMESHIRKYLNIYFSVSDKDKLYYTGYPITIPPHHSNLLTTHEFSVYLIGFTNKKKNPEDKYTAWFCWAVQGLFLFAKPYQIVPGNKIYSYCPLLKYVLVFKCHFGLENSKNICTTFLSFYGL